MSAHPDYLAGIKLSRTPLQEMHLAFVAEQIAKHCIYFDRSWVFKDPVQRDTFWEGVLHAVRLHIAAQAHGCEGEEL